MLVIEFVNHIKLLLWIMERYVEWEGRNYYCALFNNSEFIGALKVLALSSPSSHNQQEKPLG